MGGLEHGLEIGVREEEGGDEGDIARGGGEARDFAIAVGGVGEWESGEIDFGEEDRRRGVESGGIFWPELASGADDFSRNLDKDGECEKGIGVRGESGFLAEDIADNAFEVKEICFWSCWIAPRAIGEWTGEGEGEVRGFLVGGEGVWGGEDATDFEEADRFCPDAGIFPEGLEEAGWRRSVNSCWVRVM